MAGIKLKFNFADLLEEIQEAGGNVDKAAADLAELSADVVATELRAAAASSGTPASITNKIRKKVTAEGSKCSVNVGWEMSGGSADDLSTGQKAAILNYGTPRRSVKKSDIHAEIEGEFKTLKLNRGAITGKHFIADAKKSSAKRLKTAQQEALNKMLSDLRG